MEGNGSWSGICDREESINKDIVIYSGEFTTLFFIAYKHIMGKPVININENEIAAWVTAIVGVVGIIYSWYKNQSITHPAQVADDVMKILKDGRITISELEDFIARYSETDLDTEADFDDIEKVPEDDVDDEIDEGSDE